MDQGLDLLIDNTSLHRLSFAVTGTSDRLEKSELGNILHVLECLVLSSDLVVNGFESPASHERSGRVLDWIESADGESGLVWVSPLSDVESQCRIAGLVAREMNDRGLLTPDPQYVSELDQIDVKLGRPVGVVEIAGEFWNDIASSPISQDGILEKATHCVEQFRTDGLFVYGAALHEDIVEEIIAACRSGAGPDEELWRRLHVVFRALFNQRLAEENGGRSYAPAPVRSEVLRSVYSVALREVQRAASRIVLDIHSGVGNQEFADEVIANAQRPLPLLGLAYLLEAEADEPSAPLRVRLEIARSLAAPLRKRLDNLESLARADPSKYAKKLKHDADSLDAIVHSKLGMKANGLALDFDMGVSIDPTTGGFSVDVGKALTSGVRGAGHKASHMVKARQKRISVLSDGLARTIPFRSVGEAVRRAVR